MWDDNRDKEATRNQLLAVVLMTVLLVVWLTWFMPKPSQKPSEPSQQTQSDSDSPAQTPGGELKPLEQSVDLAVPPGEVKAEAEPAPRGFPPIPEQITSDQYEETIENDNLRLVFTRVGGRLKRAGVRLYQHGREDEVQIVPEAKEALDAETVYPLGLRFSDKSVGDRFDQCLYDVTRDASGQSITFSLTIPDKTIIRKTFSLTDKPYVVDVRVDYENLESEPIVLGQDLTPAYILNWGPNIDTPDKAKGVRQTLIWRMGDANDSMLTSKMKPPSKDEPFVRTIVNPAWVAVKSAYFLVGMKPESSETTMGWALGNPEKFRWGVAAPRFEAATGATQTNTFLLYLGPSQMEHLAGAWPTLSTAYRFFEKVTLMDWFAKLLLRILNLFYRVIPSYGVAIILLTLLVRLGMFPLTIKQMRSMKKMQMLAPELEKLKEKYGEDQAEFQRKTMEMYRERGVNPLGGCLPLLLQMPVFIALYRMLWSAFELRGAPFVLVRFGQFEWIKDLAEPDRLIPLPFLASIPWVGEHFQYLNLLPILGAVAMVISTKLTPTQGPVQNPQQKMMMTFMPIFFSVICYNFASGLNLYILTGSVLQILQSKLMPVGHVDVDERKPIKKKQHFYTAAMARKRQLAKELKDGAKRNPSTRPNAPDTGNPKTKKPKN